MRYIRLFLISVIVLFLLMTAISLFFPSQVRISRAINVKATPASVMKLLSDPRRWKDWHPGLESAQPLIEDGKVNGLVLDASDPSQPVAIRIKKIDASEVVAEFRPKRTKPVTNVWRTIGHSGQDSLTVHWYMDFKLRWYPWEKFGSLVLEKSHGAKMEQGLTNLKTIVQAN